MPQIESTPWLSDAHRAIGELLSRAAGSLDAPDRDARDAVRRLARDGLVRGAYHRRIVADLERLPPSRDGRVRHLAALATTYEDRRDLADLVAADSRFNVVDLEAEARAADARYRLLSLACRIAAVARSESSAVVLRLVAGVGEAFASAATEGRHAA